MTTRRAQQGITLMGMIMALAIAGIFAYCGMKVFPMYQEFWAIKSAADEVAATPGIANAGRVRVLDLLERRFIIDYVDSIKMTPAERTRGEKILIDKKGGRSLMTIRYEVRKPLAYNLDVVGKFEHSVTLSN
jgi:hypothetical protein